MPILRPMLTRRPVPSPAILSPFPPDETRAAVEKTAPTVTQPQAEIPKAEVVNSSPSATEQAPVKVEQKSSEPEKVKTAPVAKKKKSSPQRELVLD